MIKVVFFAQTRELIGEDGCQVEAIYPTVDDLRYALSLREGKWALALDRQRLLAAVNQTIVGMETPLNDDDEVAFFPPVTGG
jgi:molybdopterin synthase sulfur carrier subunit